MRSMKVAAILSTLALVGTSPQAAEQPAEQQNQSQAKSVKPSCTPVSCVEFSQAIDAWRLASLAGDDKIACENEARIMKLIDRDIEWCTQMLSDQPGANPSSAKESSTGASNEDLKGTEDTYAWELFGAKKRIAWNIRHTDAFSNKYRLLGDYEDLIKREKSADRAGVPLDMQEKGEHTLREAGK